MTEVIYSVIIRHIVKWTIVETVIPAGSGESPCTLCSASCQGLSVSQDRIRSNVHIPRWTLKVDSPLFCLHKKLLMQVFTLGSCLGMRWRWLGITLRCSVKRKLYMHMEWTVAAQVARVIWGYIHRHLGNQSFEDACFFPSKHLLKTSYGSE